MTSDDKSGVERVLGSLPSPPEAAINSSQQRVKHWYRSNSELIFWTRLETKLGRLFLAANQDGLLRLSFATDERRFIDTLERTARLVEDTDEIKPYRQQLEEYMAGRRLDFSLPTNISTLSDFQQQVLRAIENIPAGRVRSYGQVAEQIGRPGGARAVGQALGRNPIPIVLPCHRVVANDGGLGGYTGGLDRKRQLLALEGALPLN